MRTAVIIPARLESSRFPRKVLELINGKPMLQHVYDACRKSNVSSVIVTTPDIEIKNFCLDYRIPCHMTSYRHRNGTERIAEVVKALKIRNEETAPEVVINVQADEPLVIPFLIDNMMDVMFSYRPDMMTYYNEMKEDDKRIYDPNVVKVSMTSSGKALYFSRHPISTYKHIGIYAYKSDVLLDLIQRPVGEDEKRELLEQLRALSAGYKIHCVKTFHELHGVDTPEDIEIVSTIIKERRNNYF